MNLKYWHLQIIGVSSIFNFFFIFLKQKRIIFKDPMFILLGISNCLHLTLVTSVGLKKLSLENYK